MAENLLRIGHLAKEQVSLLPNIPIQEGNVIYNEKNGMQFTDYLGKRYGSGSVISGIFNGTQYVDFSTAELNTIIDTIKNAGTVYHGQLLNINNSIFMYKKVNDNHFIVKINDTETSVDANAAGYIIHLPEYQAGDSVTIDLIVSLYDATHGEKVFFVKIENGGINYSACQDLHGPFVPGDLGLSVVSDGGLIAIVSTLDSNLKVISYSVDSTGSAINNGFYIAAGDMKLVYEWIASTELPYNAANGTAVVLNNEIHLIGGSDGAAHYKLNGTSWESVSTVVNSMANGTHCAVVYNDEIHVFNNTSHYKWNGTSWVSVSTIPFSLVNGVAVVYDHEIHVFGVGKHYKWNGTRWISVSTPPANVHGAVVYNNALNIISESGHYTLSGSTWTSASTLPMSNLSGVCVIVHGGMIHLLGGSNNTSDYSFNGTAWESEETLPFAFVNGTAVTLNGALHIMGSSADTATAKRYYVLSASK